MTTKLLTNYLLQTWSDGTLPAVIGAIVLLILAGIFVLIIKCYRKVPQGTALIRTGMGGPQVTTGTGIVVVPVIHRAELMDISVKRIEIARKGEDGLICKDNLRADIKVAFFVRVNNTTEDILQVAQSLGCERASERQALIELFDAKFSEALKTVGKQFDFVSLYNERDRFKEEIIQLIGTDLNGYILDDSAIDFLEQTPLSQLDSNNILDSEGIKKITDLTAKQQVLANQIQRDKEKVIKKQDVEAREAILELERQREEAEQKQQREIANIKSREHAEAKKVAEEERLKSERARLITEEEVKVAEENLQRQVIVAQKNKERTQAVENERIEKDRLLEFTERERVVELATIEKDKAIEVERKDIQDVIRERVIVERAVVEEKERIKDTEEIATAERAKTVAVTKAAQDAEEGKIREIEAANAARGAATHLAEQKVIQAEALRAAAEKEAEAKKLLAQGTVAEEAAPGLADAQVMEVKADAHQKYGVAEADVLRQKYGAEAEGIREKAAAMKELDGVGREHEEFRLRLEKERDVDLESIRVEKDIAEFRAQTVGTALEKATIDIVGGEAAFFDKIVGAVGSGKAVDRTVLGSNVLTDVKETFFNGDSEYFKVQLHSFMDQFGLDTEDVKNLSIATLIGRLLQKSTDDDSRGQLKKLLGLAESAGVAGKTATSLGLLS